MGINRLDSNHSKTIEFSESLDQLMHDSSYIPTYDEAVVFLETEDVTSLKWLKYFYEETKYHDLLVQEHVKSLAKYIRQREDEICEPNQPLKIIEVGAGNGRLTHFLNKEIKDDSIQIVAIDSGANGLEADFPVESIGYQKALEKYQPDIVISSWMPYEEDWTADFRATPSVQEYVLIGEGPGGCCGRNWETWGMKPMGVDDWPANQSPPYKSDGFLLEYLSDMSRHQICRSDWPGEYYHSSTYSFRRQ